MTTRSYSIEVHKHRFASWAAARAATVNGCRFRVEQGKKIIERSGLRKAGEDVEYLPAPEDFDKAHRKWRGSVIRAADRFELTFTHGVAAKLINVYLKSIFVCGGQHEDPRVMAIHPPIDGLLLESLYRRNTGRLREQWRAARKARWSKLSSEEYENLIAAIKKVTPEGSGLWHIEKHWRGFQ